VPVAHLRRHAKQLFVAWRASPRSIRTRVAGVTSPFGEICMLSIVVGFAVVTLFATGLLLVMQRLEDFR